MRQDPRYACWVVVANKAASDSERFQSWLQDFFDRQGRNPETETIAMGPFRAIVTPGEQEGESVAWVTLVDPDPEEDEAVRALKRLQAAFRRQTMDVEIEYDATALHLRPLALNVPKDGLQVASRRRINVPHLTVYEQVRCVNASHPAAKRGVTQLDVVPPPDFGTLNATSVVCGIA